MCDIRAGELLVGFTTPIQRLRNSSKTSADHVGNSHPNVFVLPGGEEGQQTALAGVHRNLIEREEILRHLVSTAYASGIIAALWSQPQHSDKDRRHTLNHLRATRIAVSPTSACEYMVTG